MKLPFRPSERAHVSTELLSAYLDNQVTAAERGRVQQHLQGCSACQAELNSLRQTISMLHALPRVAVPRAFTLSEAQVRVGRPSAQPAWLGSALRGLAAVSAILIVAVVGAMLLNRPTASPVQTLARLAPTEAPPAQPQAQVEAPAAPSLKAAPVATRNELQTQPFDQGAEKSQAGPATAAPAPPAAAPEAERAVATAPAAAAALAPPIASASPEVALAAAPTAASTQAGNSVATASPAPAEAAAGAAAAPTTLAEATQQPQVLAMGRGGGSGPGATATIVTPEAAPPTAPVNSVMPAGAALAYGDPLGLWVLDRESGLRQIVQGQSVNQPIISGDRAWVVYRVVEQDAIQLWAIRWTGQDAHLLLSDHNLPAGDLGKNYSERRFQDAQWIPGRHVLAVVTVALSTAGNTLPQMDLWNLDVDTGTLKPVFDLGPAGRPLYSPDGSRFVVSQPPTNDGAGGAVTVVNADGSDARIVLKYSSGTSQRSYAGQMSWLPDGNSLWVAMPDFSTTQPPAANGLMLYRVPASGASQQVAHLDAFDTHWSTDGRYLAYSRVISDAAGTGELYLARADGSGSQLYSTLQQGMFVSWSPDNKHFLYNNDGEVYVGAAGQTPVRLGNIVSVLDPQWVTPDQVFALLDQGTSWMLVSHNVGGKAASLFPLSREATFDIVPR